MVTNFDGYDPNPPRDGYCEHGTYVGGCGYDFMCGPCEMGEPAMPELTAAELADVQLDYADQRADEFDHFVSVVAMHVGPSDHGRICAAVLDYFDHDHRYQQAADIYNRYPSRVTERESTS